jgi:hypothetical protein
VREASTAESTHSPDTGDGECVLRQERGRRNGYHIGVGLSPAGTQSERRALHKLPPTDPPGRHLTPPATLQYLDTLR